MKNGSRKEKRKTLKSDDLIAVSICILITMLLMAYVVLVSVEGKLPNSASGVIFRNHESIVTTIRIGLRRHSEEIKISFHAKNEHMDGVEVMVAELMEEALGETSRADEGDYIRYQYGGYQIRYSNIEEENGYLYTVRIIPEYYTYLTQEKWVSDEVKRIISEMNFSGKTTDYEKAAAIYNYVCENVSYDVVHKGKDEHHIKTTAYASLKYRTAVCQGYSVLLYRLFREAGLDARVITGTAVRNDSAEFHSWNLVRVDGEYYNVDATWDRALDTRDYFLKSDETFSENHKRDEQFTTDEFVRAYTVSEDDYMEFD